MRQFDSSLLSLKAENNLLDFIIVFIDGQMNTNPDCLLLLHDLQTLVSRSVRNFDNSSSSLQFIQAEQLIKIFLILSGSFRKTHGHHYVGLPQVECVYVFCHDVAKHKEWARTATKVRGIFEDKKQLLTALCSDVKIFSSRWSFLDERSFQQASSDDGRWYQLFFKILVHQPTKETARDSMMEECRLFYRQDEGTLKAIDSFENDYTAGNAIHYYCQDSFLYRIINAALRTRNVHLIAIFQPYIRDLYSELQKWYRLHRIDCCMKRRPPIRIVYRGQYTQEIELERLRELCRSANSQVALNVFGSATYDPEVALGFIPDDRPGYVRCLYQIIIPHRYETISGIVSASCQYFVDIKAWATMSDEKEVLFSVGCLFLVKYVGTPTARHGWVPVLLELNVNNDGFDPYWGVLSARIQNETDEMKRELLLFVQTYTPERNKVNWMKWWHELKRICGARRDSDEPTVVEICELLGDSESISRAIQLRKRLIIDNDPSIAQSVEKRVAVFLSNITLNKPTKIIALYEILLQTCNRGSDAWEFRDENTLQATECADDALKLFECAGDAYAHYGFYRHKALKCYQLALLVPCLYSTESEKDGLQAKVTQIFAKTTAREPKQPKQPVYSKQKSYATCSTGLETDNEQWSRFWLIQRGSCHGEMHFRRSFRLIYLHNYLTEK